jgi:5'-nucleotidase
VRVLLTNDDGVAAEGMRALRKALADISPSVVTIAPVGDMSGRSRAITPRAAVRVRQLEPGAHPVFECAGTPADCVRAGLLTDLLDGAPVDLVVSGINHGSNLGDDVAYSGTVGAGLEAAALGVPALCFSRQPDGGSLAVVDPAAGQEPQPPDFTAQAALAARMVRSLSPAPSSPAIVLNVNFPDVLRDDRLEVTRLGRRWYPAAGIVRRARVGHECDYFLFGDPDDPEGPPHETAWGTDFAAVASGVTSVTPLAVDWGDRGHPDQEEFLDRIGRLLPLGRARPASEGP